MAQRSKPDTPAGSDAPRSAVGPDTTPASAELRIERSRFSRLLARFGLGELTDPILRPTKSSAGQASNG
jgi:hypothetical protein